MTADMCDVCGTTDYTSDNPYVEVRIPRPSDPTDLCCIVAGCRTCFPGTRTGEEWEKYMETDEARAAGYMWLS